MSAPTKPWEGGGMENNNSPNFIPGEELGSGGGGVGGLAGPPYRVPSRVVVANTLPPLPPRARSTYPRMSPFSMSPYGGYGMGGMGAYGMGGYPYGMRGQEFENRYVQLAEESAAPAFESIESFVRGFSAITMMLESTYQAVHMSFRAVLSIAENMSRMRAAIFDFLSALSIFRTIYYFYRKVLQFLGLVNGANATWQEAERLTQGALGEAGQSAPVNKSVWPMLTFLGAVIAGPALVYKYLLPNGVPEEEEVMLIATHDFYADQSGELSFVKGDRLFVKRSQLRKGWMLARKGNSKGMIPSTRVGIARKSSNNLIVANQRQPSQTIIAQPVPREPINQTNSSPVVAMGPDSGSQDWLKSYPAEQQPVVPPTNEATHPSMKNTQENEEPEK